MTPEEHTLNLVKAAIADLNPNEIVTVDVLASKIRAQIRGSDYLPAMLALKFVLSETEVSYAEDKILLSREGPSVGVERLS